MAGALTFRHSAVTETGPVRALNEDSLLCRPDLGLWAVADGLGGHAAGDLASRSAVQALAALSSGLQGRELMIAAHTALDQVNRDLLAHAEARSLEMVGTTICLLLASGGFHAVLWSGDSRAYLARDGRLTCLTRDHSLGNEVADSEGSAAVARLGTMAERLVSALGVEDSPRIDKHSGQTLPGDRFLLCSDGLYRGLEDAQLLSLLASGPIEDRAAALVAAALAAGSRDNTTAIAIEVSEAL